MMKPLKLCGTFIMTSILTNTAALSALQTLRAISSNLGKTQEAVSSGLRVSTAADNAAYWSISTGMRSDSSAMQAIQDAIGLGIAKVDTAYAAMHSTIDVLSEFHAKLVAAKEEGVDKAKIQEELDQLKNQTVSIAQSASFNGVNWLNTDYTNIYDLAETKGSLTAAFVRNQTGGVKVETIDVDLSEVSLYNTNGGGILQADDRSPGTVGGIKGTVYSFAPLGSSSFADYTFDGPLTFSSNATAVSFTLTLDADDPSTTTGAQAGVTQSFTINRSTIDAVNSSWNGVVSTRAQWRTVLQSVLGTSVQITQDSANPSNYSIWSRETSARGASYQMTGVSTTLSGSKTGGLQDMAAPIYGSRAYTYSIFDGPFELKPEVEAYISIDENGASKTLVLDRDVVMAALGTTTGEVNSRADFIQVMNYAFAAQGMGISATPTVGGSSVRYDLIETINPEAGRKSSLGVMGATDNIGSAPNFGLQDIDITTSSANIDLYVSGVQSMMQKAIDAGALLGALRTRLDLQESFNATLMDSVASGIGRLVDADMNEASTRMKALQTQQQLATQSLQIANNAPEVMLALFQ